MRYVLANTACNIENAWQWLQDVQHYSEHIFEVGFLAG